jgi:hypothetical protein
MDNAGVVFLAVAGGMICGAVLIAGIAFTYFRVFTKAAPPFPTSPLPPALPRAPQPMSDHVLEAPILPSAGDQYRTIGFDSSALDNMPWLDGIGGVVAGQRININLEETVLGRSRVCDIQLHDPKISRQHAMLRLYKGRYFLQDMQSSRGTLVNSQPVQTHLLEDGDQIRMGDSVMIFRAPASPTT